MKTAAVKWETVCNLKKSVPVTGPESKSRMGVQLSGGGQKGGMARPKKWGNTVFENVPREAQHWPDWIPKIMNVQQGHTSSHSQNLRISVRVCQNPDSANE